MRMLPSNDTATPPFQSRLLYSHQSRLKHLEKSARPNIQRVWGPQQACLSLKDSNLEFRADGGNTGMSPILVLRKVPKECDYQIWGSFCVVLIERCYVYDINVHRCLLKWSAA